MTSVIFTMAKKKAIVCFLQTITKKTHLPIIFSWYNNEDHSISESITRTEITEFSISICIYIRFDLIRKSLAFQDFLIDSNSLLSNNFGMLFFTCQSLISELNLLSMY